MWSAIAAAASISSTVYIIHKIEQLNETKENTIAFLKYLSIP